MKTAILESPFKNDDENIFIENYLYTLAVARRLMLSEEHKIAPCFFHALFTQFLADDVLSERRLGIESSFLYHEGVSEKLFTIDRGISEGMVLSVRDALSKNIRISFFTAMPDDSSVGLRVSEINAIEDNENRAAAGLDFVAALITSNPNFAMTHCATDYKEHLLDETNDVKKILDRFMGRVIRSIN